ncbi:MAG: uroporphyrinogen-III C-methyltransferase [Gemmatimonadota bacterium]|nr:uroporphyrinogen-III C-methyltransferase [Gemmatimonadota bacterium]
MRPTTALLLAAHGSRRDAVAAQVVERLATALRTRDLADEVVTAYHQGTPGFGAALDQLQATQIVVLPVFTSEGYYTEQVLPAALETSQRFGHVALRRTSALGTHPRLADLLRKRIAHLAATADFGRSQYDVLLIGHGTSRHPRSRATTLRLAEALRQPGGGEVGTGFLDDHPSVETALASLAAPGTIVVPFLIGGGGHASADLPARLGLVGTLGLDSPIRGTVGRRRIILDRPLGADEGLVDLLADLARRELSRFILPEATVALVGAGPGDPELITVRGLALLRAADVVLHDRLSAPELLDEVRPDAIVIDVGKVAGAAGTSQLEINAALIRHARAGRSVVRLKGGDPYVFGRGAEEADACRDAGVACSVVPGISSAIAVPAAVGIPLTSRGESRSFAVVTAQGDGGGLPASFTRLADSLVGIDTVVILMGRAVLGEVTAALIAAGRDPTTPAACVEEGTTSRQRVTVATLASLAEAVDRDGLVAPIVTVIGAVAERAAVVAGAPGAAVAVGC